MTVFTPRGLNQLPICSCLAKKLGQKVFILEIQSVYEDQMDAGTVGCVNIYFFCD